MPIDRQMNEEGVVYYTMEYYSTIKKNEILPFAATQVEGITVSEISQTEKDKYCMFSLICGI